MSAKSWVIVALAVAALCVLIGIAVTASTDFVVIALMAMAALVVTYFAGWRDERRGRVSLTPRRGGPQPVATSRGCGRAALP